jgi:hypothetical protein
VTTWALVAAAMLAVAFVAMPVTAATAADAATTAATDVTATHVTATDVTATNAVSIAVPSGVTVVALATSADSFGPVTISGCAPDTSATVQVDYEYSVAAGTDPLTIPVLLAPALAVDGAGSASAPDLLPSVAAWLRAHGTATHGSLRLTATCSDSTLTAVAFVPYELLATDPPTSPTPTPPDPGTAVPPDPGALDTTAADSRTPTEATSELAATGTNGPSWIAFGLAAFIALGGAALVMLGAGPRRRPA